MRACGPPNSIGVGWHGDFLPGGTNSVAIIEMDWYIGIKRVTGKSTGTLGASINPTETGHARLETPWVPSTGADYNYLELRSVPAPRSGRTGTVGVTVFYFARIQYEG